LEHLGFPVRVVRSIEDARDAVRAWGLPSIDVLTRGPSEHEPSQAHTHGPSGCGQSGSRSDR
jgi:hypothetical protein